jgi:hypothetical protein
MHPPSPFRFQIALSFPGEFRPRVKMIAEALAATVTQERVLYDEWIRAELARPNLDVYLPQLYHEQSLLLVFFLCGEYARKDWCGLEWRAGRDLLKRKADDRLMFLRLDHADIPGIYSIDGYLDISSMPDDQVAAEILKRLAIAPEVQFGNPPDTPVNKRPTTVSDPHWQQRVLLPETAILKKIWSKPGWNIWIRPTEFKRARFQNLDHCQQFMRSRCVHSRALFPYPWFSLDSVEIGDEWIAGEIDLLDCGVGHAERWVLLRSGQFVHNLAFDETQQPGGRIHVLEILDTVTGAFELAAAMANQGILSPGAAVTFKLQNIDGLMITWPQEVGGNDAVGPNCWCRDANISIERLIPPGELGSRKRQLSLQIALEIYAEFGWSDPPKGRLSDEQNKRFGLPKP